MARLVMGQIFFADDAAGRTRSSQLLTAARGVMQHAQRHGVASPEQATSWMAVYDVADDGTMTLVDASHLGATGPVNGMPNEPAG